MLKVGMFIQNRYEIISRIGSGGMADVYKAKDHKLNRFVAVKVLKKEFRDDKVFISKFRVEAQSAAGLAHSNIVNIYDVGEEAGIYYIVMELIEGITLKEYIKNKGHLSVREATSIALQISAGLEAAHNNGIIHRDVKPQNIMISTDGKVKVADFGIARAVTTNTANSAAMGSVHYSSPEQSRGGYSDEKSDIYSLGITMYEMLTGCVPFDGDTAVAVAIRHLQEEIHGPAELVPEISYSTNQIVLKCTQKNPDRRYANMTELIRDLRESLVNPDGDFVVREEEGHLPKAKEKGGPAREPGQGGPDQKMPAYDESLDVGAAANLHKNSGPATNRAYQPGSYYQKSTYQEVPLDRSESQDGGAWEEELDGERSAREYDPYFDAYDNPDDYAIREGGYKLDEGFAPKKEKRRDDSDIGLNPRLEKAVTVGGIIVAVIIGCVFLVLLANAFGLFNFRKKPQQTESATEQMTQTEAVQTVSVPKIDGKPEKEALDLLASFGLPGKKTGEGKADGLEPGQVYNQSPKAGEMVTQGSTVSYQVVEEEEDFVLSDLSNQEQNQAQAFLLTKGLKCEVDTSRQSDTVEYGHVITTEPGPGTKVKPGDTVKLFVSQAPQTEPEYVQVRDLYYYSKEVATEALELQGFIPAYDYEPNNEGVPDGWVIRSVPAGGEQAAKGSTVTLIISTGPGEMPAGDDNITFSNEGASTAGAAGTWRCNASLDSPAGYNGQPVRITLKQNGTETTVFEGTTNFPYSFEVQGASGVSEGTAYVYLLDPVTNAVTSTIEYAGITFSQVN